MHAKHSLDTLKERLEELVIARSGSYSLSQAERGLIAKKFAQKSLQELHDIVRQLDAIDCCED